MKVAMITCGMDYGAGTHTKNLTYDLRKLGVEVDNINSESEIGVSFKVPNRGYDIVHIQGSPFNFMGSDLPTVVTIHSLLKTEMKYLSHLNVKFRLKYRIGQFAERLTLRSADAIIAVNPQLINEYDSYHIDNPNLRKYVIPNGINFEEFNGRNEERENFFMTAGRELPRKDYNTFREACKKANVPYAEFHNAPRSKLVNAYKTAKAFVCSSLYETGPITMLEAIAARCPTICTDVVYDNMIPPRPPGLWYHAGNIEDLVSKIQILNQMNKEQIEEMTGNAYKMGIPYSWSNIANQTLKVYEELV